MNRFLRSLLIFGSVLCVLILGKATPAYADVNDFTITSFKADYTLTKNDPQGDLHIIENIDIRFSDNNHGILRAIPNNYKKHRLQIHINKVSSTSGAMTEYSTYGSNGNTVVKIGNPNKTVTGNQKYIIDYNIHNVISFYKDHDEFYWDINGDQWEQPFERVSLTLHMPGSLRTNKKRPICYTGSYGSSAAACEISIDKGAPTLRAHTTKRLGGYQTLSVVAGFDKSYFSPSKWYETVWEYEKELFGFFVPFLTLGCAAGFYWFRRGRDAKGKGTIVPQYDVPDKLKPIEVGTIIDFKTDNRDITATIIDFAIRGYIKIIENKQVRRFRHDKITYALRLVKYDTKQLKPSEASILTGLFGSLSADKLNSTIDLTAINHKLAATADEVRADVKKSLISDGYFRSNPIFFPNRMSILRWLAWALVFILAAVQQPQFFVAGFILGILIGGIFLYFSPSRTTKGTAAKEYILGLKQYLEVAEADRIKMLQSPDAPYAANKQEPVHTVELFEKLLPFAVVLGVEKQWAKKFESIYTNPPDWYSGNWTTFNAVYLTSSLSEGVQSSVNSAFSSAGNSSGSGFGGGGAGGGGGGGGGGGW